LIDKGFSQREGIDYTKIFSPVVKFKTIHMMLIVVVHFDLELEQLDVKTAFLHGNLDKLINMEQPTGYIDIYHPEHVCLFTQKISV